VQWGPIVAGSFAALGSLLLLTVLGLAIGTSAIEPGSDITDWGTGAGLWGGASIIVALFIGGWVATKTAAVDGSFAALMNGLICGLATVFGILIAVGFGIDNALGFFGANLSNLANFTQQATVNGRVTAGGSFNDLENGAWGTLLALVLAFGAAALGGLLARHNREDLVDGTA